MAVVAAGLALPAIAVAESTAQTFANTTEIAAGGLIFSHRERLVVDLETLTIGLDQIDIQYVVRSLEAKPFTLPIAFPMPTIDMAALQDTAVAIPAFDPTNPTNFVGFWTVINGIAIEPDVDVRALAIGHIDVTAELNRLGLPLYPLAPTMPEKLASLGADDKATLADAQVLAVDSQSVEPLWALRTVFHWKQQVLPEQPLTVQHHYKPIVGSAPWTDEIAAIAKSKYCMSAEISNTLNQRTADGKQPTVYWVHYAPGNNAWLKGPSSLFKLVIEKPEPTSLVATCASGLAPSGDVQLEKTETSRNDDAEIEVLFVE
jgi:Domain of unknown function (DUF4424)